MVGESRSGSAASRFGTSSSVDSRFTPGLRGDASRIDTLVVELAALSDAAIEVVVREPWGTVGTLKL